MPPGRKEKEGHTPPSCTVFSEASCPLVQWPSENRTHTGGQCLPASACSPRRSDAPWVLPSAYEAHLSPTTARPLSARVVGRNRQSRGPSLPRGRSVLSLGPMQGGARWCGRSARGEIETPRPHDASAGVTRVGRQRGRRGASCGTLFP
jgi:hypothetical protein